MSNAGYGRFMSELKEAADVSNTEASDITKGLVGRKAAKERFLPSLMYRSGAPGYSTDFQRVWEVQTSAVWRWYYANKLTKDVQPAIEGMNKTGDRGWANRLQGCVDEFRSIKKSAYSDAVDFKVSQIPIFGAYAKKGYWLERFCGWLKATNYWAHLQTGKFTVMQKLQPWQFTYPLIGSDGMMKMYRTYGSPEGTDILKRHKVTGATGKLQEVFEVGKGRAQWAPAAITERANQEKAFLGVYLYGRDQLNMPDHIAADFANLNGRLWTQFTYVRSDIPPWLRGPVASTLFQYSRFKIKSLMFGYNLAKGNVPPGVSRIGAVGKFLGVQMLVGGVKTTTFGAKALGLKSLYERLKEDEGEDVAQGVVDGLPSLVGIDISNSIRWLDIPEYEGWNQFYKEFPATIGKTMIGPTGQRVVEVGKAMTETTGIPGGTSRGEIVARALLKTSPTAQQFYHASHVSGQFVQHMQDSWKKESNEAYPEMDTWVEFLNFLDTDTHTLDVWGRTQYTMGMKDYMVKLGAFKSMPETLQRRTVRALAELQFGFNAAKNIAITNYLNGDTEGMLRAMDKWNGKWGHVAAMNLTEVKELATDRQLQEMTGTGVVGRARSNASIKARKAFDSLLAKPYDQDTVDDVSKW